ncbi:hypothetical protein [Candidatus Binatus sp.]|uniref:hypothetical protein n=1 Tax=Candidatus Binatus sp. TaxID=2811406 RepID=UPI003C3E8650
MVKEISLKHDNQTLGRLIVNLDGTITLRHDLTPAKLLVPLLVVPVDEENRTLKIIDRYDGKVCGVALLDHQGAEQLVLHCDDEDGSIIRVVDPKGIAGLRTNVIAPGSNPAQKEQPGELVFELVDASRQWKAQAPFHHQDTLRQGSACCRW